MIEAQFEYRCRRCCTMYRNPCCSVELAPSLLQFAVSRYRNDAEIALLVTHTCGDGGAGIADLQGYRIHGKESE